MKTLLLIILAFGLSSSAFAQEALQQKQWTRVVASGKNQPIGFFTSLNPDCTAIGNTEIRITKQPEHGKLETTPTSNFPSYPKDSNRYKCNEHRIKGIQVSYKSAEKYVGSDELELLVLFPSGFAWEVHYDISVR
jgi:hypothetical protein